MTPIVTLTTDFGLGPYVAQMKAVLLGYRRDLQIVDIAHDIPPQNILRGAIALADASTRFPPETYHLAVIDPGVGTDRHLLYVEAGEWRYLLPDNGLIEFVSIRWPIQRAIRLTQPKFWAPIVASTFHGRDKLAHVAGHLLQGVNPLELGESVSEIIRLPLARPTVGDRSIRGEVLFADHFGNLITNISLADLKRMGFTSTSQNVRATIKIRGTEIVSRWSQTYGAHPPGTWIATLDSQDRLEIAVVNGNAAESLQQSVGCSIEVVFPYNFC